jgi:nicotinamide riboside kinase
MKIAITGTHSSGKTSLAKEISSAGGISYVQGDKASEIFLAHFPDKRLDELSVEDHWRLQNMMFENFNQALELKDDCVTDGLHLTCIPYGNYFSNDKIQLISGYKEFEESVMVQSNKFDLIFYLPPEIELELGGIRPSNNQLRLDIDKQIKKLLKNFKYKTLTGSVRERLESARKEINMFCQLG